ncbi:TetR family transcriptional regulator [Sphaerisporangium melleum]|uniref:TetR family transcriptional regulator n=1 Tax=Sphaerisporangium melleum TaxID=321316 RepID=A0A917VW76_9ACTN|nr:TetR/AcrR family transcriptional regulator [Sphaerisporangium melleum]GGL20262.1 TetR family transcriptional regulator [Sphaerisporangium melleum]GII69870.1 TetR family transcriptional regulator [Sphaerisporangium melleum]
MAEVKGRNRRSVQTRRRIIDAAHKLFVAKGYAGTTFQDVADAADVSVPTVYFHYGTKSGLLKQVIDVASAGDDEPVALLDRPWFAELKRANDPAVLIRRWVEASATILDRVAPVLAVVHSARGDAEMEAQWTRNSEERRIAHGTFVQIMAESGTLRPDLTERQATDITVGLLSPDLFLVLTRECGWTTTQWETWTAAQLAHNLLPPAQAPAS